MTEKDILIFIAIYIILYPITGVILNMIIGGKDVKNKR